MLKSNIQSLVHEVITECLYGYNKQTITEGISIGIGDYENKDINNIHDLAWWLASKVQYPIMKKMSEEEKSQIKHDIIQPDGDDFDKTEGNLNIYIGFFPEKWRPMLLGGIQHFMQKHGVKWGKWVEGISNMYGEKKITIPIETINPTSDPAPNIHMSYSTAKGLRDALGIGPEYGDEYSFSISVNDLIRKLKKFRDESKSGLAPSNFPYYNEIVHMAKWAKDHGYTKISGA